MRCEARHAMRGSPTTDFRMPAEWEPHERTLMAWPCRRQLWGAELERAMSEYAIVAQAIAQFEPVLMVCPPGRRMGCVVAVAKKLKRLSWTLTTRGSVTTGRCSLPTHTAGDAGSTSA